MRVLLLPYPLHLHSVGYSAGQRVTRVFKMYPATKGSIPERGREILSTNINIPKRFQFPSEQMLQRQVWPSAIGRLGSPYVLVLVYSVLEGRKGSP